MASRLVKLFALSWRDVSVLAKAWFLFAYVDWVVSRRTYARWPLWMRIGLSPEVEEGLQSGVSFPKTATGDAPERDLAEGAGQQIAGRIVRLCEISGRHHLRPMNCMRRCLVQRRMLEDSGLTAKIVLGARAVGSGIEAHAWLTLDDELINDSVSVVSGYRALKSASTLP